MYNVNKICVSFLITSLSEYAVRSPASCFTVISLASTFYTFMLKLVVLVSVFVNRKLFHIGYHGVYCNFSFSFSGYYKISLFVILNAIRYTFRVSLRVYLFVDCVKYYGYMVGCKRDNVTTY